MDVPRLATGRVRTTDGDVADVPEAFVGEVESQTGKTEQFERPTDVAVSGQRLFVRRADGTIVSVPVQDVKRIEVTDETAERDTIILAVVGAVAGAAAVVGSLAYVSAQADPW